MRLLNADTKMLREFFGHDIPPYAILSHTWGEDEVTLQGLEKLHQSTSDQAQLFKSSQGFRKIEGCCEQALKDHLQWVWVDTCCIDKTSSAELSEAINSMFLWYRGSRKCYAYLSDVSGDGPIEDHDSSFRRSRWFSRGWTLQELLAPVNVHFYSESWGFLGERDQISELLHEITEIPKNILEGDCIIQVSIAQKMSWASKRITTRIEDMAYCLLGLFDVNMPLLYGEGEKAFLRLQEELSKITDDQSLFAWGLDTSVHDHNFGIFATSPRDFVGCGAVVRCRALQQSGKSSFELTKKGMRLEIPIIQTRTEGLVFASNNWVGILNCRLAYDSERLLGIPLVPSSLVTLPTAFREDMCLLERPRYRNLETCSEYQSTLAYVDTVYVGIQNIATCATDFNAKAAFIRFQPSSMDPEDALMPTPYSVIIPHPQGPLNWRQTLLGCDPLLHVHQGMCPHRYTERSMLRNGPGEPWRQSLPQCAYFIYESETAPGGNPARFYVRVKFTPALVSRLMASLGVPSLCWPFYRRGDVSCRLSVDNAESGTQHNLEYLRRLTWKRAVPLGKRLCRVAEYQKTDFIGEDIIQVTLRNEGPPNYTEALFSSLETGLGIHTRSRCWLASRHLYLGLAFLLLASLIEKTELLRPLSYSIVSALGNAFIAVSLYNLLSLGWYIVDAYCALLMLLALVVGKFVF